MKSFTCFYVCNYLVPKQFPFINMQIWTLKLPLNIIDYANRRIVIIILIEFIIVVGVTWSCIICSYFQAPCALVWLVWRCRATVSSGIPSTRPAGWNPPGRVSSTLIHLKIRLFVAILHNVECCFCLGGIHVFKPSTSVVCLMLPINKSAKAPV